MEELVRLGIQALSELKVDYGEVRAERREEERIATKNVEVDSLSRRESRGIGFRVLVDGAWGFAATADFTADGIRRAARQAVEIARATARLLASKVSLVPEPPHNDVYYSPFEIDPLAVPVDRKLELLFSAASNMLRVKGVALAKGSLAAWRREKWFGNTEGSFIHQVLTSCGAGIEAYAASGGEFQRRSYPNSFGGDFANRGFEFIEELDLPGNAERVAEEAVALLSAPVCPTGEFDVIIDGSQMALQVHESLGHPAELDRVLGTELSFAGGSFLTTDKLGHYRYGSELVTIVADATVPGGLGSFGYDDEGVPVKDVRIIEKGILKEIMLNREYAKKWNMEPNGHARAENYASVPIIRMRNTVFEPGDYSFEELLEGINRCL